MGGSATGYRVLGRMILGKEDDDGGGSDGIVDVDVGLIFFLCSVFLASLIMSAYAKIDVSRRPSFSLTLFFLGCLLTGYANAYDGTLAEVIELCQRAHPHVILYLLLPPLLFYSALTIEPNIFHKVTAQAVLLAGPGVLIVVMFIAPLCNLFNFGWSWTECFLLAAILSATDPVSVTSALKEMGAPEKLNMIIEGESLLNDGSAYVLFVIFKAMANPITGPDITAGEICITFLQLAFGGVLWGYVSGLFISFVLLFVKNLAVVQTSLMLCGVYTTFILAETTLGVSGVLAAVTYGIYMAGRGKLAVSQEVEESNQAVLKQVDFWCNAVVFLLAGVVVCDKIIDDAGILGSSIGNWLLLLLLYLSLNLVRALSLVILMPLLKRSGYGMTKGEAMIISNAGLRGAVGLALSLAVHDDTDIPYMHRNENNFFVAGIVCLTLLINGPSTKWLYIKLDLYPVHPFRAYTFQKAMLRLEQQEFAADESSIKSDWFHTQSDWELVRLLVPNFTDAKLVNGHVMLRPLNSVKSKFKSYTEQVRGGHAHPGGQSLLSSDFLLGDGDSAGAGEAADHLELEAIDSKRDNRALSDAGGLLDEDTVASRGITRRRRELNPEDELEGKEVKKSHEVEDSIRYIPSLQCVSIACVLMYASSLSLSLSLSLLVVLG
jgi:NhaP-type Na+/H+ or K+/H+ antiporter